MNTGHSQPSKWYGLAWVLAIESCLFVFGLGLYGFLLASRKGISSFFNGQTIDRTSISFAVMAVIFGAAVVYVYKQWRQKASFIAIGTNHYEVEPCDRRDEFEEIIPSYFQ